MSHRFWPVNLVIDKQYWKETLECGWKGSHTVILPTPTAVRVVGSPTHNRHPHVKPVDLLC